MLKKEEEVIIQNTWMRRIAALMKWKKIGRVGKGFDFLGFHCRLTGMTVSEASLSRRDQKIVRFYEQGESKERVGTYLRRWLRWAGAFAGCIGWMTMVDLTCASAAGNQSVMYVMIAQGEGTMDRRVVEATSEVERSVLQFELIRCIGTGVVFMEKDKNRSILSKWAPSRNAIYEEGWKMHKQLTDAMNNQDVRLFHICEEMRNVVKKIEEMEESGGISSALATVKLFLEVISTTVYRIGEKVVFWR